MSIDVEAITPAQAQRVSAIVEGHFGDAKSTRVAPSKLTKSLSAFANADGGDLYIGLEEPPIRGQQFNWVGFPTPEDANGHIQALDGLFPLGQFVTYEFLKTNSAPGLVLHIAVLKAPDIRLASDGIAYVRRGAQSLPYNTPELLEQLKRAKGLISYERSTLALDPEIITNSEAVIEFMLQVVPSAEPETWLRKQLLIEDGKPTVAGVLLFADEPQVAVPKAAIKIYRYKTTDLEGSRDTLGGDPETIEGALYQADCCSGGSNARYR